MCSCLWCFYVALLISSTQNNMIFAGCSLMCVLAAFVIWFAEDTLAPFPSVPFAVWCESNDSCVSHSDLTVTCLCTTTYATRTAFFTPQFSFHYSPTSIEYVVDCMITHKRLYLIYNFSACPDSNSFAFEWYSLSIFKSRPSMFPSSLPHQYLPCFRFLLRHTWATHCLRWTLFCHQSWDVWPHSFHILILRMSLEFWCLSK